MSCDSVVGLVEIVTEAETLRKIQVRHGHGIAGSFKDSTIAHWLQAQNPTELEYEKVVTKNSKIMTPFYQIFLKGHRLYMSITVCIF